MIPSDAPRGRARQVSDHGWTGPLPGSVTYREKNMATNKPRITITLETAHHAVLQRIAAQQKRSMSSVVSDLVGTVVPSMQRVASLFDRVERARESILPGLVAGVDRAEQRIIDLVGPSLAQKDLFDRARDAAGAEDARRQAPPVKSRHAVSPEAAGVRPARPKHEGGRGAGAARGRDPRPVNTGVRSRVKPAQIKRRPS